MHPTYALNRVTPLKILLNSKAQIGTGRFQSLEVIPYTETARQRFCPSTDFLPDPPNQDVPEEFLRNLRPYQQDTIRRLISRKSSANLSDPRTGKTPTALRLFKAKGLKKFIIITLTSATYQWKDEVELWYDGKAEVLSSKLSPKQRIALLNNWGTEFEALIISYGMLKKTTRKVNDSTITYGMLDDVKKQKHIDGIIVDEIHRVRHHRTAQAKAVFALSDIPNKHVLTGTPAHNKTEDVYSLLHFLYPEIFTGYWRFIFYYYETESNYYGNMDPTITPTRLKHPTELAEFLSRISVQHKRQDVMPWLTPIIRQTIALPPTTDQLRYVKELKRNFETEHVIVENILGQLMRTRQVCAAPELLGLKGSSPKLDWLTDFLTEHPDDSVLIFSNFTSFLRLISQKLDIPYLIIGDTPDRQREDWRVQFQDKKINRLLINIQAGKEALTLDTADTAIFLDIYPPYGDIEQAENRFTKTTEREVNPSFLYRVIIRNTYDETLCKLVDDGASENAILNNYANYLKEG